MNEEYLKKLFQIGIKNYQWADTPEKYNKFKDSVITDNEFKDATYRQFSSIDNTLGTYEDFEINLGLKKKESSQLPSTTQTGLQGEDLSKQQKTSYTSLTGQDGEIPSILKKSEDRTNGETTSSKVLKLNDGFSYELDMLDKYDNVAKTALSDDFQNEFKTDNSWDKPKSKIETLPFGVQDEVSVLTGNKKLSQEQIDNITKAYASQPLSYEYTPEKEIKDKTYAKLYKPISDKIISNLTKGSNKNYTSYLEDYYKYLAENDKEKFTANQSKYAGKYAESISDDDKFRDIEQAINFKAWQLNKDKEIIRAKGYDIDYNDIVNNFAGFQEQKYQGQQIPQENVETDFAEYLSTQNPEKVSKYLTVKELYQNINKFSQDRNEVFIDFPKKLEELKSQEAYEAKLKQSMGSSSDMSKLNMSWLPASEVVKNAWNTLVDNGVGIMEFAKLASIDLPRTVLGVQNEYWQQDMLQDKILQFTDDYLKFQTSQAPVINDAGDVNLYRLPGAVISTATDMALLLAGTGKVIKGIGLLTKAQQADKIALTATGFIQQYGRMRQQAEQLGLTPEQQIEYAAPTSFVTALMENLSPKIGIQQMFTKGLGNKIATNTLIKGLSKGEFKTVVNNYIKEVAQENIQEISQTAFEGLAGVVANNYWSLKQGNQFDDEILSANKLKETVLLTTLTTMLMSSPQLTSFSRNSLLYESVKNKDKVIEELNNQIKLGNLSKEKGQKLVDEINNFEQTVVKKIPKEWNEGQKTSVIENIAEKSRLEQEKKTVDENFKSQIDEQIKQEDKKIQTNLANETNYQENKKETVSQIEWDDYLEFGIVSEERLNEMANKSIEQYTGREKAMFDNNTKVKKQVRDIQLKQEQEAFEGKKKETIVKEEIPVTEEKPIVEEAKAEQPTGFKVGQTVTVEDAKGNLLGEKVKVTAISLDGKYVQTELGEAYLPIEQIKPIIEEQPKIKEQKTEQPVIQKTEEIEQPTEQKIRGRQRIKQQLLDIASKQTKTARPITKQIADRFMSLFGKKAPKQMTEKEIENTLQVVDANFNFIIDRLNKSETAPKELKNLTLDDVYEMAFKEFVPSLEEMDKKTAMFQATEFITRDGKPIGFIFDTDVVAREKYDFSKLKKIGSGSDRDVYDLWNGKVLKVAKTARGLEQNIYEGDNYLHGIIPTIYERGLNYVVVENVEKAKNSDIITTYDVDGSEIGTSTIGEMINEFGKFTQRDFDRHEQKLIDALYKYGFFDIMNYEVLWGDFNAKRNWGYKDGKAIHTDGGTFGGVKMLEQYKGKTNLSDPEFRNIYNESKRLKKQFGDTDKNTMYQTEEKGLPLFQKKDELIKGAIAVQPDKTAVIGIFKKADVSTILHEAIGHGQRMIQLLSQYDNQVKSDWEEVKKYIGAKNDNLTRTQQEKLAKLWEKYFSTGNAPTDALKRVFNLLKEWFSNIYQSSKEFAEIELPDNIKNIFDTWLGKPIEDTEIKTETEEPIIDKTEPIKETVKQKIQTGTEVIYKSNGIETNGIVKGFLKDGRYIIKNPAKKEFDLVKEKDIISETENLDTKDIQNRKKLSEALNNLIPEESRKKYMYQKKEQGDALRQINLLKAIEAATDLIYTDRKLPDDINEFKQAVKDVMLEEVQEEFADEITDFINANEFVFDNFYDAMKNIGKKKKTEATKEEKERIEKEYEDRSSKAPKIIREEAIKKRILESKKAPKLLRDTVEESGIEYVVQNQEMAKAFADWMYDEYGYAQAFINSVGYDIDAFIYGRHIDELSGKIKEAKTQKEKIELTNEQFATIDAMQNIARQGGRFNSALKYIYMNSPEGLYYYTLREIEKSNNDKLYNKKQTKKAQTGTKINDVNKQSKIDREEAAQQVVYGKTLSSKTTKTKPKPTIRTTKEKIDQIRKDREKVLGTLSELLSDVIPVQKAIQWNDLKQNAKWGEILKSINDLGKTFIDEGYVRLEDFVGKMVDTLTKQGIVVTEDEVLNDLWTKDMADEARNKYISDNAEKLASKIVNRLNTPSTKFDPIKQMISTLFGKVDEKLGDKQKKLKLSDLEKIRLSLKEFADYRDVYEQSKDEVDLFIDNMNISQNEKDAYKVQLQEYYTEFIGTPFSKTQAKKVLKKELKDKIDEILVQSVNRKAETKKMLIDDIVSILTNDLNIPEQDAKSIAETFAEEYDKIIKEKILSNLNKTFPATPKDALDNGKKRKKDNEKIAEQIAWGVLDDDIFRSKFYEKWGLTNIKDPKIQENLKKLSDKVYSKPKGYLRDLELSNLDAYISYVTGKYGLISKTLSLFYNNILLGYTVLKAFAYNSGSYLEKYLLMVARNPKDIVRLTTDFFFPFKYLNTNKLYSIPIGIAEFKNAMAGKSVYRQEGETSVGRMLELYGKTVMERGFGQYIQASSKLLNGIDLMFSTSLYRAKLDEKLVAEVSKNRPDLNRREIYAIVDSILGRHEATIQQAQKTVSEEMIDLNRPDNWDKLTQDEKNKASEDILEKNKVDLKLRMIEVINEGINDRLRQLIEDELVDFPVDKLDEYKEYCKKWADKSTLFGVPEGTPGAFATILSHYGKVLPISKFFVATFINAPLNFCNIMINASPLGVLRAGLYTYSGLRAGYNETGKLQLGKAGRIISMIGMTKQGERILEQAQVELTIQPDEVKELWGKVLLYNAVAYGLIGLMGGMTDDDDEIIDTAHNKDKWEKLPVYITASMTGDFYKNLDEKNKYGIEEYTLYIYGHKVINFKSSPMMLYLGFAGEYMDGIRYGKSSNKSFIGKIMQAMYGYTTMITDQASLSSFTEILNSINGKGEYWNITNMSDKATYLAQKLIANNTKALLAPRIFYQAGQDIQLAGDMAGMWEFNDKKALKWYELFYKDMPIIENMALNDNLDPFGRPIKDIMRLPSPIGLSIFDIKNGEPYTVFDQIETDDKYWNLCANKKYNVGNLYYKEATYAVDADKIFNKKLIKELDGLMVGIVELTKTDKYEINKRVGEKIRQYIDKEYYDRPRKDSDGYVIKDDNGNAVMIKGLINLSNEDFKYYINKELSKYRDEIIPEVLGFEQTEKEKQYKKKKHQKRD